jgi:hypothetical protein
MVRKEFRIQNSEFEIEIEQLKSTFPSPRTAYPASPIQARHPLRIGQPELPAGRFHGRLAVFQCAEQPLEMVGPVRGGGAESESGLAG